MKDRVYPTTIQLLAAYFVAVMLWLVDEATRLGIDAAKLLALTTLYGNETTAGTYLYCKHKYDITPGIKGTVITQNLADVSKAMKKLLSGIYNDIPASKWTNEDRATLNRKTGLEIEPTHQTIAIADLCVLDIQSVPIALIKGGAKTSTESNNHSVPEGANAIEIRYCIVKGKFPIEESMKTKVKEACIGPNDGTTSVILTKALFSIQVDESFSGYNIQLWGRWINVQNRIIDGMWSEGHNRILL